LGALGGEQVTFNLPATRSRLVAARKPRRTHREARSGAWWRLMVGYTRWAGRRQPAAGHTGITAACPSHLL